MYLYVVKVPVYYRRYPPGRFISADVCRSTWVLVNGLWNRVETEAPYSRPKDSTNGSNEHVSSIVSRRPLPLRKLVFAYPRRLFSPLPMSQFSLESYSCDPAFAYDRWQPFNNGQPATLRVITTLLRLVHGGGLGEDGALIRACGAVIDHFDAQKSRSKTTKTNIKYQDEWRLDGHTLTRVHNVPRTSKFVPPECDDCPIDLSELADDRITEHFYRSNKVTVHDSCASGATPSSKVKNELGALCSVSSLMTQGRHLTRKPREKIIERV